MCASHWNYSCLFLFQEPARGRAKTPTVLKDVREILNLLNVPTSAVHTRPSVSSPGSDPIQSSRCNKLRWAATFCALTFVAPSSLPPSSSPWSRCLAPVKSDEAKLCRFNTDDAADRHPQSHKRRTPRGFWSDYTQLGFGSMDRNRSNWSIVSKIWNPITLPVICRGRPI